MTVRRTALLGPGVALLVCASPGGIALAQQSTDEPAIHDWPTYPMERNPAGLYSWRVGGTRSWMHKVPEGYTDDAPNSVEITIGPVGHEGAFAMAPVVAYAGEQDGPYPDHPVPVADVRSQKWLLDVDGEEIYVLLESFPGTDPALLAEAEAVVDSIDVRATATGQGRVLVFELPAGWDDG